jgi:hypothetical protein
MNDIIESGNSARGFIAASYGSSPDTACLGILNECTKKITCRAFNVSRLSFTDIERIVGGTDDKLALEIKEFLAEDLKGCTFIQSIAVAPSVFLDTETSLPKVIILLASFGYCSVQASRLKHEDADKVFLDVEPAILKRDTPKIPEWLAFSYADTIAAYGEFRFGKRPTGPALAAVAALCVRSPGLYYFLTSGGEPQSSQDVVEVFRSPDRLKAIGLPADIAQIHSVVSGTEAYSLETTSLTKFNDVHRVPLVYSLASKKFSWLEPRHARKIALLTVCRDWSIQLTCTSMRSERFAISLLDGIGDDKPDEGEEDKQLRMIIKSNYEAAEIAQTCKSAFLLAIHRWLHEQKFLFNELELRLFTLAGIKNKNSDMVYNPLSMHADWAESITMSLLSED